MLMEGLEEKKSLESGLRNLGLGNHLCCIYRDKDEQSSLLTKFMKIGLERNEKCLYIFDDRTKEEIMDKFRESEINLEEHLSSRQFEFLTKRESYLKDGYFEPDKMLNLLTEAKEKALKEGYNGLRATGEMTWFFSEAPGVEKLMKYESRLNDFLQYNKIFVLCQYNEKKFPPENLIDVIYTHPKIAIHKSIYKNHYYMPRDVFAARVKGKVDRDYYVNLKDNITKEAPQISGKEKVKGKEEKLQSLNQTLEELEKISN